MEKSFVNTTKESPPNSHAAEQAIIGGLLLENEAFERVSEKVIENDFFHPNHRVIFKAICELMTDAQSFDVLILSDKLRRMGKLDLVGGVEYLQQLGIATPTTANLVAYANIVREKAILRNLINCSSEIANSAYFYKGRDTKEILDRAEQKIFAIGNQYRNDERQGFQAIKKATAEAVKYIEEVSRLKTNVTGYPTGFSELDDMTAGLQPGDLIILAARPSMGKTAFAMNIVENIALQCAKPVGFFSLEMPARHLAMRLLSSLSKIDGERLRVGKFEGMHEDARLKAAVLQLQAAPILIDDSSNISPMEMRSRARRLQREQGQLGLLVVDYLQLMSVPDSQENRNTQISEISRSLKLLAKELNVPVLALSQLSRAVEHRSNRRPMMSDLRESGAIEQDADLVMFINREETYKQDSNLKGIAEIIVAKQRNGPIGDIKLAFLKQYARFENMSHSNYEDSNY